MKRHLLAILALALFPGIANAYFSVMDTGDVTPAGQYRVILEPQLIVNKYDGMNLVGRFDTGVTDNQAVRALVGFGEVDFQIGALYKWVPFPDTEGQPAIGLSAGLLFARVASETEFSIRIHPHISKRLETEIGDITPYISLPLGVTSRDDNTFVPVQVALGSEWKTLHWENLRFMGELGFDVNDAFSYISVGLVYQFDNVLMGKE